jgi:2-polyprenyl-3-methyl-5-hydroxy-6-metoxy-1,4-benzoquinol methylase
MPWHLLVRKHLDLARDVIGKRMLEIGCGRGEFVCWLASQGERPQRIVAADFASTAVSKAREFAGRNNLGGIEWEVGDIQAIAHPSDSFDTVISCETVEHVPDPRGAIRELARVLRRGGRLLLTTPNYMGPLGLYRMYLRLCGRVFTETGQPLNHFMMLPATRDWVARAGLHVTAVDAVGHYLPFPGRPPIELRALSRRGAWMRWLGLHSLIVAEKR